MVSENEDAYDILERWIIFPQSERRELTFIETFLYKTLYIHSIFNEFLLNTTMFLPHILISADAVGIGQMRFLLS